MSTFEIVYVTIYIMPLCKDKIRGRW